MHFERLLSRAQRSPSQATGQHTDRGARLMCARVSGANNGRTIADIRCNLMLKTLLTLVDGIKRRTLEFEQDFSWNADEKGRYGVIFTQLEVFDVQVAQGRVRWPSALASRMRSRGRCK